MIYLLEVIHLHGKSQTEAKIQVSKTNDKNRNGG
jgi:hypothetical protein